MLHHNVVAIDKVTLAKAATEEGQDTKEVKDENFSAPEPVSLNDTQDDSSGKEAKNMAPGKHFEDARQQEASALTQEDEENAQGTNHDTKSQVGPTEYVADRIVDTQYDERKPLHGVRGYGYRAQDSSRNPAKNLLKQSVAHYKNRVRRMSQ